MTRLKKTFRLWTFLASLFTLFNVAGISAGAVMAATDDDVSQCAGCMVDDDGVTETFDPRRHSDLI